MKKLIISGLAILLAMGLMGGAFAYFQDTETSTENTLTAGTFDLKVANGDEVFKDGVTATWTMSDMQPGVTTVGPHTVSLQNSGTIAGDHVEISFSHTIDELSNVVESDTNPESTPGELARWIQILRMDYYGVDWEYDFIAHDDDRDPNDNGFFDLEDVTLPPYAAEGGFLDGLSPPPPNSGGTRTFSMRLMFHEDATNDIQGDILTTTVTFTLNQEGSQ